MATSIQFFHCNKCDGGRVKKTIKATKKEISITVGNCTKCKASYGIKSIADLEAVTKEKAS